MLKDDAARIKRKLSRLPQLAEKRIRAAMEKSADEIVDMMRRLVPVSRDGSHGNPPGTLRDSIGWTWGSAPKGSHIVAQSAETESGLRITIYAGSKEAYYARWVEFGTRRGVTAQPFFYPSYRANRKRTAARTKRAIRKTVKEIWNGH